MPFVQRSNGGIVAMYANPQDGYAEEWLDETDAEVVAFRNPPATTDELRDAAIAADTDRQAFVALLKSFKTGADVKAWWASLTSQQKTTAILSLVMVLARNAE